MDGRICCFYHPMGAPLVSHHLYADDLLVFANGERRLVSSLVQTLKVYEKWSGQLINKDKLALFFSKHIIMSRRRSLLRLNGFVEGKFPLTYLGVPLVSGWLTSRDLESFVRKIKNKMVGWKLTLLSQGA